ncbi:MAG: hypothetical protein JO287_23840 [Pseudonocardiales bacterium]|nr:hypothetical protein [Pseudonocardiales bacterium]
MSGGGYVVEWSEAAIEDLLTKVKYHWVADELMKVAQTSLDEHHPPDGGHNPPLYWRRGLTVQQRNMLDDAETRREDWDYDEQPWQYVLYYRRQPKITLRHSYLVVAVRHDKELLASLLDL